MGVASAKVKKKSVVKKVAAKSVAASKPTGPAGPFVVFEGHAVSWFDALEDAVAHRDELASRRADGSAPVVAGVIQGG